MDEEDLLDEEDDGEEMEEIDTMFMGTESEARRRFQRNGPYRPRFISKPRLPSRDSRSDRYRRQ